MNGVHDMGGMHGMGPIGHEPNPPVWHEPWEPRAWALYQLGSRYGRGKWKRFRYELERIPPVEYLRMPYYERWFTILVSQLLRSGFITAQEYASGRADPSVPVPALPPPLPPVRGAIPGGSRLDLPVRATFKPGQHVRARNINPEGHTRLPRYVRGRRGVIIRDHGIWASQDTNPSGDVIGEPQHVYTVRFAARELWGETASARDAVFVDAWESHLERG